MSASNRHLRRRDLQTWNPFSLPNTAIAVLLAALVSSGIAADWRQFRGPGGLGVSAETGLPTTWSAEKNIAWKTPLPGFGSSSPITLGTNIFVTCYSGYGQGVDDTRGSLDKKAMRLHLLCVDAERGTIQWSKSFPTRERQNRDHVTDYTGFTRKHGYASSTPVSDGEAVYTFFGETGVIAFDLNGDQLWTANVGTKTHGFGTGASPILHGGLLIVNASIESESVVGLDKKTGREVWRAPAIEAAWNTPMLVDAPGGAKELVVVTKFKVHALDPRNGKQLWEAPGSKPPMYVCPSVTTAAGVVYAVNGYHGPTVAVRSGGRGDVSSSHQLWSARKGSTVSSPVFHDGHLFWANDQGLAICVEASTGKIVYQERIEPPPGDIYASALAAEGKLYYVSRLKGTYVVPAKPKYELLAHNVISSDDSVFNGSPVPHNKSLLLRSDKFLYRLAGR